MIENLKPYPEYKDSGLPWLGEVPAHWEIRPASGAFSPIRERNTGMKERIVLSLSYGRIVVKPAEKLHGLVPESFETYQIVNPGVTIIRTTDLQNDKTSLRMGIVRDRGIITSAYLALSTSADLLPEFGYQILNAWDITKALYGYGSGLRQNLDFSDFRRMPVAVPPISEQAAIARFLAWATNRLDRAIGAKRRIISLLQEQKQAIIHRAVTRGLDPSVPLKDSGIPWLGEIPEHWEVRKLKRISPRVGVGLVINPSSYYVDNHVTGFVPMLLGNNIAPMAFKLDRLRHISHQANEELPASRLFAGDIVVVRVGAPGVAAVVPPRLDGCNCASVMIVRGHSSYSADWLALSFNSPVASRQIDIVKYGAAQKQFNIGHAVDFLFPVPPLKEQQLIVDYVATEALPISKAISRVDSEITLLHEYRTRLIADVVTGKLDVRKVAAGLPEDVERPIQSDAAGYDGDEAEDDSDSDPIDTEED